MGSKLIAALAVMAFWAALSVPAQTQPACTANSDWFPHAKTPEPNSAEFPKGLTPTVTNCSFHKWSWNAFLWLTQDVKGKPRFEHFTATGIEAAPGVLDPLIGRSQKSRALDIVEQAGPNGIMVDLQGRPIYYSIHSDATFGDFIKQNDLLDPAKLRAFDPNASFPVGSMTLKAAWKVVAPGENVSTFYTRQAKIALLTVKNGKIVLSNKTKTVRVALVGFHVAGAVKGHPEMIWATFEHKDNAPDLPKAVNDMGPNEVVSDKNWTFYKAGTEFKDCNINSAGAGALKLDAKNQTLSPVTQVCRIIPFGGGNAMNVDNIKSLNNSVHSQLKGVWNNYFELGAIWFNVADALQPNCTFQPGALECKPASDTAPSILTGSTQLSNTTVETFTQSQSAQDNCFACHNTVQVTSQTAQVPSLPGLNVDISHVLIDEYFKAAAKQK
jgi:ligand-binding SRPBCC domain-containing protein